MYGEKRNGWYQRRRYFQTGITGLSVWRDDGSGYGSGTLTEALSEVVSGSDSGSDGQT
jgi:hypothetical protein